MEVKEEGEGGEGGDGTLRTLEAIEFLTQEADPRLIMLVDACNGFKKMSRLAILWTVRHHWQAGARFALNCYMHRTQLLLCQAGESTVTFLRQEGVNQGNTLSMVLYRITLVALAEELRAADPGLLSLFYANNAAFDG